MSEMNDMCLIREYADCASESAFADLVHRHIHLVYSVAFRYVGNSSDAQDITQAVFVILAKKAASLRQRPTLTGWLYETTRFTAAALLRTKVRQQAREQEAYMQSTLNDSDPNEAWRQLAPVLEEAMNRLNEKERTILALRLFDNKTAAETAALLGIQEGAAHKRAARALEKLRRFFLKRGINSTTATIAGVISTNSVHAAPTTLAKSVTAVAIAKGAVASGSILILAKGAMNLMAWAKVKTIALVGTSILITCGAIYLWEVPKASFDVLNNTDPRVKIVPTKFPDSNGSGVGVDDRKLGISMPVKELLEQAYGVDDLRIIIATKLPDGKYDYIANLPSGSAKALQQELKKQFGIVGHFEPRLKDVFVLKVINASALKLTPRPNKFPYGKAGEWSEGKQFHWGGQPTSGLANWLEGYFQIPVVDQIGMTNASGYDFVLDWDVMSRDSEKLKQALNQVGLGLIYTNQPIEMLVVKKVN